MLRIQEIKRRPSEPESVLPARILASLGLGEDEWRLIHWEIEKKAVDARDKKQIRFVYSLLFSPARKGEDEARDEEVLRRGLKRKLRIEAFVQAPYEIPGCGTAHSGASREREADVATRPGRSVRPAGRPVIVGFGPCGMFAAYVLAMAGLRPLVLERGKPMEDRSADVADFWRRGVLQEDSNVLFGEGGAGAFSDGKLTTGLGDPRKRFVLETLAEAGGGKELVYLSRPHIGTDLLRQVVVRLRSSIRRLGGEIRFGVRFSTLETDESGRVSALLTDAGERIQTDAVILAIGHSARDTFHALYGKGLRMERKSFSMGFRIEHPQQCIDEAQYGKDFHQIYGLSLEAAGVPGAEYKLAWRGGQGRGVYTFCMCPGGQVISVASEKRGVCTNGMSNHARNGSFANSAVLADVAAADFDELLRAVPDIPDLSGDQAHSDSPVALMSQICPDSSAHGFEKRGDFRPNDSPLTGLELQRKIERAAYQVSLSEFRASQKSVTETESVSPHGYTPLKENLGRLVRRESLLRRCLPSRITEDILEAMPHFGRKIRGFDDAGVTIIGPETRSSSPIRIPRSREGQSSVPGVFPCGEGAGYAGGIMSAAIDGIRGAEAVIAGGGYSSIPALD